MNAVTHDLAEESSTDAEARIVALLLRNGRLKEADLARARPLQRESGGSLLPLLVRLGLVSERDHAQACAEVLALPLLEGKAVPEAPPNPCSTRCRCRCASSNNSTPVRWPCTTACSTCG